MNKWMIFNKNIHLINILFVTNEHVQALGSDRSAFNSLNGGYDFFYIHHCNSCCCAMDACCGKGFSSFQGRAAGRVFF